jgi:feruloyl esterase
MKHTRILTILILFSAIINTVAQTTNTSLDEIKKIKLAGVTITEVQEIPAGNYTPPGGKPIANLPSFIRVAYTSKPVPESKIRSEIWLPKDNWNGRLLGTGNGGGAGGICYGPLASGLMRGFATANTDMGTSIGVNNAVGHPEIWKDFGYRATHEMTVAAKAILKVYYKKPAGYSYFVGCSTGGQQALMEAQRYPEDYNGIIAGAPANNRTHLHAYFVWNNQAIIEIQDKTNFSQKKIALVNKILLRKYSGKDGGAPGDNFFTDPRICKFDPKLLPICPDGNISDSCFSNAEIAALEKLFAGPVNPRTGERIYDGLPLSGNRLDETTAHFYPFLWAFGKDFDYKKFDFDKDMARVDSILAPIVNANNPDLKGMKERGGKIIMYTGTADLLVPYQDALNYYERVIEAQHGLKQTQEFFRYYLVPGMGHCGGGNGLNEFGQGLAMNVMQDREHDILTAMEDWVEKKIVPDKIIATTFNCCDTVNKIRFQRPIYPYPKFPEYKSGDPNLSGSYTGKDHPMGGVLAPARAYLK